jgi:tRNA(fMet)-specific endonuclease VapC
MILLDTDTVTHFSYGNENVKRKIEAVGDEELGVSIITRNEIIRGRADNLLKAANEDELRIAMERFRQAEAMLSDFLVVELDDAAIRYFGELRKQKKLKKMKRPDMLIACTALAQEALLVTRNTKDFQGITGLRLDNWVD